ncbi:MAG TPA: T9SS type A sorting domain-containing protein [Acidobacteriota bacterium]|nr:T9SS type A sorting domain-containing protein [Acidobacteriota bacterium]
MRGSNSYLLLLLLLAASIPDARRAAATPPVPPAVAWPANGVTVVDRLYGFQLPSDVAPDGEGGAFVAWSDQQGEDETLDVRLHRVTAQGDIAWSHYPDGFPLGTAPGRQFLVRLVGDGAGGVIATWYDERGATPDIYALRVRADGTAEPSWPVAGLAVCDQPGAQMAPVIASDDASGAYIAWEDQRDGAWNTRVYVQHILASGAIADGWPAGGMRVGNVESTEGEPTITTSPDGGAFVTWIRWTGETADIVTTRVTAAGSVAPGWPAGGLSVCAAPGHQDWPSTVSDGDGGIYAVWRDHRYEVDMVPPTVSGVFIQRVTGDAAIPSGWAENGVAVRADSLDNPIPQLAEDGLGGALVCWADGTEYFVQRYDPAGAVAPGWKPEGVRVGAIAGFMDHPGLVGDGAGGAIAMWTEYHGPTGIDVYAQRIAADGSVATGWPTSGTAVSATQEWEQFWRSDPRSGVAVSDGSGGALVVWANSAPYGGVRMQRVNSFGAVGPLVRCPDCDLLERVFPNPAPGPLRVRVRIPEDMVAVTVDVFDVQGRKRLSRRFRELRPGGTADLNVDASNLPTGVYFVRVAGGRDRRALGTASVRVIR